ncbi:MAG: hypothetical protein PHE56_05510 [Bacteroidales bacterium]|nr:hypothetical protein [Bacteroidales bacterium]
MAEKTLEQNIVHKVTIDQQFQNFNSTLATLRKEIFSNLLPVQGMDIQDSAWGKPKGIEKVTISFTENSYYLQVSPEQIEKNKLQETIEMFKLHGWKELLNNKLLL